MEQKVKALVAAGMQQTRQPQARQTTGRMVGRPIVKEADMRSSLLVLAAAVCALSCGAQVDPTFSGDWNGKITVQYGTLSTLTYDTTLIVTATGAELTVNNICPAGAGAISAQGDGKSVGWSGSLPCRQMPFAGCQTVNYTMLSASFALTADDGLSATHSGTASGCGASAAMNAVFHGFK